MNLPIGACISGLGEETANPSVNNNEPSLLGTLLSFKFGIIIR